MAPPQSVAAANVRRMEWSGDGDYLLVLRENPLGSGRAEVLVWSRRGGKTRSIGTVEAGAVREVQPMGTSDRFVVEDSFRTMEGEATVEYARVSLVSAANGSWTKLSVVRTGREGPLVSALVSSRKGWGLLESVDDLQKQVRSFGLDGRLGLILTVTRTDGFLFGDDGTPIQIHREPAKGGGRGRLVSRRLDLATGRRERGRPGRGVHPGRT